MIKTLRALTVLTALSLFSISYADSHVAKQEQHDTYKAAEKMQDEHAKHMTETAPSSVESLSPKLREVLSKEMVALEEGMKSIIPAYISGNWHAIGETALKMKNSYILKQKLTPEQAAELHSKLSPAFIEKDQEFHYLAGMLAHAAESKKPELVGFYFSKLSESCVGCHTKFALHKFPAFKGDMPTEEHQH